MTRNLTRRHVLTAAPVALGLGLGLATSSPAPASEGHAAEPFVYGLNTSTINGNGKLTLTEVVEIAAEAGYKALEPWIRELDRHVQSGGSLKEMSRRIKDHGMSVASAIGFFDWAVDDDSARQKGFEEAKRNMALVRELGGTRIAAPPAGATKTSGLDLRKVADRYRALLELGDAEGVVPQVEVWGFSQTLTRLGEAALVAIEAGHPKACILPDVYHLYKGGSRVEGLALLGPEAIHVFHMNDYPADPPRSEISDAQRVYPGDGVAPLKEILRTLRAIGFHGTLSLELFNRDYWAQDPKVVARTGLEKMRAAVLRSV